MLISTLLISALMAVNAPIGRLFMRLLNRIISFLTIPFLLLCLGGCGGEKYENPRIYIDRSYETISSSGGEIDVKIEASDAWGSSIQYDNSNNTGWVSLVVIQDIIPAV